MKKSLFIPLLAATIASAGCTTTPTVSLKSAKPVPLARVWDVAPMVGRGETAPGKAIVSIIRDSAYAGSGCLHQISVDDVKVVDLGSGEFVNVALKPGSHVIRAANVGGNDQGRKLCRDVQVSEKLEVRAGEHRLYQAVLQDTSIELNRVD